MCLQSDKYNTSVLCFCAESVNCMLAYITEIERIYNKRIFSFSLREIYVHIISMVKKETFVLPLVGSAHFNFDKINWVKMVWNFCRRNKILNNNEKWFISHYFIALSSKFLNHYGIFAFGNKFCNWNGFSNVFLLRALSITQSRTKQWNWTI